MSGTSDRGRPARGATSRSGGLGRLVALTAAAATAGSGLLWRASVVSPRTLDAAAGLGVDRWVELAVLGTGLLAAAWLTASGALALACVAASRLGRRWRVAEVALERLAPATVRRLVRSAVGVGVGAGLTLAPTAALAADVAPTDPPSGGASVVLDLGWRTTADATEERGATGSASPGHQTMNLPEDRDSASAEAAAEAETTTEATAAAPATAAAEEIAAAPVSRVAGTSGDRKDGAMHVVLRGDTLWDIAAHALGGSPTDAEILREVTRWHAANRDVVGADPDVLLPGQVLRAPA